MEDRVKIISLNSPLWKQGFELSPEVLDWIKNNGNRVTCTLPGFPPFTTAPTPLGDGLFVIVINQEVLKKTGLSIGDQIPISFELATDKYGIETPEEFLICLENFPDAEVYFESLTPGKKRNLIYLINKVKSSNLRTQKSLVILNHLVHRKGNLDFKALNEDFKNNK